MSGDSRPSSLPPRQTEQQEEEQLEDGYEVMNSIGPRGAEASLSESPKPSIVVLKEPSSPALGGTVNLILSFGNTGESQVQVLESPAGMEEVEEDTSEPVHRVRNTKPYYRISVLLSTHISSHKITETDDICCCSRRTVQQHSLSVMTCMGFPSATQSPLSSLAFTSSFFPIFSLSPLCLTPLPVKTFGGAARGFWKILWVA